MDFFKKPFAESVESLRKSFTDLFALRSATISDSKELKRIESEWKPCKEEIIKGNTNAVLSVLDRKFDNAVKDIRKSLEYKAKKQEKVRADIVKAVKNTPSLINLLLGEDFISESRYNGITCRLVKGHKAGVVSDENLKKIISYKKNEIPNGESVYVKDTRTQYADVVLVNDRNEILFTIRNKNDDFCPGGYCLPGGHIEPNEAPMDAALRELSEETGIALKQAEIEPLGEYIDNKSHIYYFIARTNVEPVVLQEEEQIQWERVSFDKIGEKPLIMNLENNLKNLLSDFDETDAAIVYRAGEIKKGIEFVPDMMGLSGKSLVKSVSGEFVVFGETDEIEKAKNTVKLVRKKVFVTRNGKTFLTTVYVNPQGDIVKEQPKSVEVESPANLEGVALGDEVGVEVAYGKLVQGFITSIRWNARDGAFMIIEDWAGKKHSAVVKNIKNIKKISSTVKVGGQQVSQQPTTPQPIQSTSGIDGWVKELEKGVNFNKFSRLGGSGDNYLCNFDGKDWVLKKERLGKEGHLASESRADFIYRAMGFDAPDSRMVEIENPTTGVLESYKTNQYVSYKELGSLTGQARKDAMKEVAKGFALDALLGNWDVVGSSGDNILVKPDGSVYRMDNGSSFEYRARGSKKNLSDFLESNVVGELESMRNGYQISGATKEAYGSLTDEEVCKQIDDLVANSAVLSSALQKCGASKEVIKAISNRLSYMESWAKTIRNKPQPGQWDRVTDPSMPSGVTEQYFKDWDNLQFSVDKELLNKDVLKNNILEKEKLITPGMKRVAKELGITVGEYKHNLQVLVEKVVGVLQPFSATDESIFDLICKPGGKYKSAIELGNKGMGYSLNRAYTENQRYGFKEDIKYRKEDRLICGYLTNNMFGAYNKDSRGGIINGIPPTVSGSGYGKILTKVKRDVALKKCTLTCANSMFSRGDNVNYEALAVPFAKPHFAALQGIDEDADTAREVMKSLESFASGNTHFIERGVRSWIEVQYHGGLKKEDVECINLCRGKEMLSRQQVDDAVNVMIQNGFSKVKIFTPEDIK